MRWITESADKLQSTDEEKRRFVEEVEKVRKAKAGVRKRVTGEDLQRMTVMEEDLEKLEEEVRAKGAEEQDATTRFDEEVGSKVTREGRGCDERCQPDETSEQGKGKGRRGRGEHRIEGREKGVQQVENMMMDEGGKNLRVMKGEEEGEKNRQEVRKIIERLMKRERQEDEEQRVRRSEEDDEEEGHEEHGDLRD